MRRVGLLLFMALAGYFVWLQRAAPAFIHAEFYGPELVTDILQYPASTPRHQYGFVYYGVLHLLGSSAEGILRANAMIAALSAVPIGLLAARWSGHGRAGLYAALLWMASPLVARLGYSEDANVTAALVATSAALLFDVAATSGSWAWLAAAVAVGQLLPYSRQSFHVWIFMFVLLWLGRSRATPRLFRIVGLAGVGSVVVATLVVDMLHARSEPGWILYGYFLTLKYPIILARVLGMHPLLDLNLSIVFPLLMLLGVWALVRRRSVRWAWLAGFAASFGSSLLGTWPALGTLWAFRLPVYVLAVVAGGAGAAWLEQWWVQRFQVQRPFLVGTAVGLLVLVSGLGAAGWRDLGRTNAEFENYRFVREQLKGLGSSAGVVVRSVGKEPRGAAAAVAKLLHIPLGPNDAALAGKLDPKRHWYFVDELSCHSFSAFELLFAEGASDEAIRKWALEDEARVIMVWLSPETRFGFDLVRRRPNERAACRALRERSEPTGRTGPPLTPLQDPPQNVYFVDAVVPELRLMKSPIGSERSTVMETQLP